MKPLHIEFVRSPAWLGPWLAASMVISIATGALFAADHSLREATRRAQQKAVDLQSQVSALRNADTKALAAQATDPRTAQMRSVQRQLNTDWNPAFATIEHIQEPGVRLLTFSIDATTRTARLEYEVESIGQATSLTTEMNLGLHAPAWRLESAAAASIQASDREKIRATWTGSLDLLR